jgi:hypothetical protein
MAIIMANESNNVEIVMSGAKKKPIIISAKA